MKQRKKTVHVRQPEQPAPIDAAPDGGARPYDIVGFQAQPRAGQQQVNFWRPSITANGSTVQDRRQEGSMKDPAHRALATDASTWSVGETRQPWHPVDVRRYVVARPS